MQRLKFNHLSQNALNAKQQNVMKGCNGKIKNFILLIPFFLIGSQVVVPQLKKGDLPVIDISKEYPKKEMILQDITDIEYIPLETTDEVLLSDKSVLSYVSDNYILVHEIRPGPCGIYVFDRTGKIYAHFNHKGQSSREYAWIGDAGTILDEKNEEIFVCAQSIQVYSLKGEYKRTLKINTIQHESKVFNFDDETLLVYDDVAIEPGFENNTKEYPYSLISKKDGSLISVLDIHLPVRYSTRMAQTEENNRWRPIVIYFTHSMYFGQDFVIADISSDTLYLLTQNRELSPLLIRKPSVHTSEPRIIWMTHLTTDKYTLIGMFPLAFNSKSRGGRIPVLMYEFETGKISKLSILDAEFDMEKWAPGRVPAMAKNRTAELIWAPSIINAYKKKQLKGDFAMRLDEDDNPVVRIIKFK